MPPIITVENLGKRYTLRHEPGAGGYRRLSEDLMAAVKKPFKRPFRRRKSESRDQKSEVRDQRAEIDLPTSYLRSPTSDLRPPTSESFWALKNVSFEVQQGEVLGIIGRNGAGKSTLLKILSRITEPTEGRVSIRGRVASLLEVGTGFHPELTGRENVFLNGAILGMTRAEIRRKFDEIVAFAEVARFLDTPVKRYSSGMYVRLAFAVSAHLEPEILIVDEVLSVGDMAFQKKCLGKMRHVSQEEGRTVFFVSHNTAMVQNLCSRSLLLERGCLIAEGDPDCVATEYGETISEIGGVAMGDRRDRNGTGRARLVGIRCLNESGQQVTSVGAGEDWILEFDFKCSDAIASPHVGFAIGTTAGQRVTRILSSETYGTLPRFDGTVSLRCHVHDLNLVPGQYEVTCEISDNCAEIIDRIESAILIEVAPRNVLGNGKYSDTRHSLCYFPATWSFRGMMRC